MTRERAKELLPVIQAYAEGKEIQYYAADRWNIAFSPPFHNGETTQWRIKPEPRFRPWRPEEVPVGCILRGDGWTSVLTHTTGSGETFKIHSPDGSTNGRSWYLQSLHQCGLLHSIDLGKTWLPCGVEEP